MFYSLTIVMHYVYHNVYGWGYKQNPGHLVSGEHGAIVSIYGAMLSSECVPYDKLVLSVMLAFRVLI